MSNLNLNEKAMLVKFSGGMWEATKGDKTITKEAQDKHMTGGNGSELGRYTKYLLDRTEVKKVNKLVRKARTFHYENTLPYERRGYQLLPCRNYDHYTLTERKFAEEVDSLALDFSIKYPDLIFQRQQQVSSSVFNQNDYPDPEEIRKKFYVKVKFSLLPKNTGDIRLELQDDQIKQIVTDTEDRYKQVIEKSMQEIYKRFHEKINHMVKTLKNNKTFRDTLVGNVADLVNLLPRLNIYDDPDLIKMGKMIETKLCDIPPQILREDKEVRKEVADEAQGILDVMAPFMQ